MPMCKNDPKSSYAGTEPSPKGKGFCAHAETFGMVRAGRDGNKWVISVTKGGVKRWVRAKPSKSSDKCYLTYDNGDRPFLVCVSSRRFTVYVEDDNKMEACLNDEAEGVLESPSHPAIRELYSKKVFTSPFQKVFVGVSDERGPVLPDGPGRIAGNSMLFKIGGLKYIHIGSEMFSFHAAEEITKYFSAVGNSGMPYPVAKSRSAYYVMTERARVALADMDAKDADPHRVVWYTTKWTALDQLKRISRSG